MPKAKVVFFASARGNAPVLDWMDGLELSVQIKLLTKIEMLKERGHELRRPQADFLHAGIYELRAQQRRVQYRILYFFDRSTAVLTHGLTKTTRIPAKDIDLTIKRRAEYDKDPEKHTYQER
ncbi:MAG: type II toxin-antitoxin system RelE/ParE family toxin [Gemmatimonadota bacterium]|nr:type II toxin-antitoxin system RelE/ParE family toxin [Gemmatimonadota bacterium]